MSKQPIALIGCGLLALGVFAPAVHVPLAGAITCMGMGDGSFGWIALLISVIALIATLSGDYAVLWLTGVASLGLWLVVFARLQDHLIRSVSFGWAWPVMAAGSIAMLIAADIDRRERGVAKRR